MSNFTQLQKIFAAECDRTRSVPDMKKWTRLIRQIEPNKAIYVIIRAYVNDAGSDLDALLLTDSGLKWPTRKNDPIFRDQYFHKSSFDSNIWILRSEYRGRDTSFLTLRSRSF